MDLKLVSVSVIPKRPEFKWLRLLDRKQTLGSSTLTPNTTDQSRCKHQYDR